MNSWEALGLTPPNQSAPLLQAPDYGTNPWASLTDQANASLQASQGAQAQLPGIQSRVNALSGQAQSLAKPDPYPSFPNSSGIGSQIPYPTAPSAPEQAGPTPMDPNASSRGFNPWSLTGEALSL